MFAVVLAKMLLYGEEVDNDLYDWKRHAIKADLPCDQSFYMNLIQICYCDNVSTQLVFDIV
jgi:hypothetical protein